MDKEKQKALKKNQSRLEDFIKVPRVIAELNQESETTFSEEEKKEILSQPEGIMRSAKLFNVLQTKENKTFFQLIKVLRRNYKDQESVISKIESEGITECKSQCIGLLHVFFGLMPEIDIKIAR